MPTIATTTQKVRLLPSPRRSAWERQNVSSQSGGKTTSDEVGSEGGVWRYDENKIGRENWSKARLVLGA